MSNTDDLVLHLKLDTIIPDGDNQRVRSALSENVLAFAESQCGIHGDPQVVPDEHFGSCLIFDGDNDYLELSPKYLGKINYILASKIVQHFFNVSEEALSVFIGAKFNPFIF
jgi:hypothetical protein